VETSDGRLVVGEVLLDPHGVSFEELLTLTDAAGLDYERTLKGALGYFAAFRASWKVRSITLRSNFAEFILWAR
jgi:hypothetical protein